MRHNVPDGDPAVIFDRALTLLRDHLERQKCAAAAKARHDDRAAPHATGRSARARYVPAAVRRAVWVRDEGRCAFVGANGRCTERGFLELHHVEPFAAGARLPPGIFSCAVGRTTPMKRRCTSSPRWCERQRLGTTD
jgi:hypothetical protein